MRKQLKPNYLNTFEILAKDERPMKIGWLQHSQFMYFASEKMYSDLKELNNSITEKIDAKLGIPQELTLTTAGYNNVLGMIMGYSLENIIKGLILALNNNHTQQKEGIFSPPWNDGHDLYTLFKRIENSYTNLHAPLNEKHHALFGKLTQYTKWRGKYPHPFNCEEMIPVLKHDESVFFNLKYIENSDYEIYKELFKNMEKMMTDLGE